MPSKLRDHSLTPLILTTLAHRKFTTKVKNFASILKYECHRLPVPTKNILILQVFMRRHCTCSPGLWSQACGTQPHLSHGLHSLRWPLSTSLSLLMCHHTDGTVSYSLKVVSCNILIPQQSNCRPLYHVISFK